MIDAKVRRNIYMARYRGRREANGGRITERGIHGGHLMTPASDLYRMLDDLHRLMSWRRIDHLAGLANDTVRHVRFQNRFVMPDTAARVESLWRDFCGPTQRDERRWPAEPLVRLVQARYGTLRASGMERQMHRLRREGLSWSQCESWAHRFDEHPGELWPDWLEVDL